MGEVYFYHLTETSLDATLPLLIDRARAAGWRIEVRGGDARALDRLDAALWAGPGDRFLPHGRAGGPHDALQPVLLRTIGEPPAHAADCLMAVEGAAIAADDIGRHARTCIVFDGHDPEALAAARAQWKELTAAGAAAQYWAQEGGKWSCKQQRAAT